MKTVQLFKILFLCITLIHCACGNHRGGKLGMSVAGTDYAPNPFTEDFKNDADDLLDVSGVSPIEEEAFDNALGAMEDTNPQGEQEIPPELKQKLLEMLEAQKQGKPTDGMRLALMGQVLARCAADIGHYAPQPGEPLMGNYQGECSYNDGGIVQMIFGGGKKTLDVGFSVSGTYTKTGGEGKSRGMATENEGYEKKFGVGKPLLTIVGNKFSTRLIVNKNGDGSFTSNNWKGNLTDSPTAATGKITGKADGKGGLLSSVFGGKGGTCSTQVAMVSSDNPIPEKYIEGMKKAGQCFRKALLLTSPILDDLFKRLDPKMANLIKTQMLGL